MPRRVAAFCRPLRPVLLLVSFRRSRSPVVGVLGLCWMWRVPFVRQRCPVVGVLRLCWLLPASFDGFCRPRDRAREAQVPCSTRCPDRPPHVDFTAALPLVGSRSCCANSPSGLRETPPRCRLRREPAVPPPCRNDHEKQGPTLEPPRRPVGIEKRKETPHGLHDHTGPLVEDRLRCREPPNFQKARCSKLTNVKRV